MSEKPKRENPTLFQIVQCLDEFKKPEHKHKSNFELAKVATSLLKWKTTFHRDTIRRWFIFQNENNYPQVEWCWLIHP